MSELSVFFQVVLVDILFAGDNAIAVGLVAAGLPKEQRAKVIAIGVGLAVILRICFAVVTVQLLKIPGLLVVGGLLLLWVCWRLYVDMNRHNTTESSINPDSPSQSLSFKQALFQILAADISMSLDNVLAVAGIARDHLAILVFGLALSVVLMLVAATYIANLLQKHRWLAYVGIIIIFIVAITMLWEGSQDIFHFFVA
ncbi:MAG: YjbE family putative metal transport protein [Acidiferrobacterales bacterium]|nr:YjbE family putative metal transport protein [Acidiferrobacterales bacterium]